MINKEHEQCEHRKQFIVCLLAFLLHILILFLIFTYQLHRSADNTLSVQSEQAPPSPVLLFSKEEEVWASTNGSRSQDVSSPMVSSYTVPFQEATADVEGEDFPSTTQAGQQEKADSIPPVAQQETVTQTKDVDPTVCSEVPEIKQAIDAATAIGVVGQLQVAVDSPVEKYKEKLTQLDTPLQQPIVRPVERPASSAKKRGARYKAAVSPRTQQLMERIASSFVHASRDEQEHMLTVVGDPRLMPTAEQIKRERYIGKLRECVHISLVTLKSHNPRVPKSIRDAVIRIVINRDGSVSNITLVQSSRDIAMDQFLLMVFADAGRSFPPLPSYFTRDSYPLQWTMLLSTPSTTS